MRRLALLLMVLAATACGEVVFVAPAGMVTTSPVNMDPVPQPVLLSWTDPDEAARARIDDGEWFYVVFLDRPPVAPGESLTRLVDDDCDADPGCPNREWFGERGVFVTTASQLTLPRLIDRRASDRAGAPDRHMAIIVIADDGGVREGEVVLTIPFTVDREAP